VFKVVVADLPMNSKGTYWKKLTLFLILGAAMMEVQQNERTSAKNQRLNSLENDQAEKGNVIMLRTSFKSTGIHSSPNMSTT